MQYQEIFERRGKSYNAAHQVAPLARQEESAALLRWLLPRAGEAIVVTAAGGGFDAQAIERAVTPGHVRIICVEPSRQFAAELPSHFERHHVALDRLPIADGTVDAVVNLAAMHHMDQPQDAMREWIRVLKPGGRLVVGDVEQDTPAAAFLNTAVDQYAPGGHSGRFLIPGSLTSQLQDLVELERSEECREDYEWGFASEDQMVEFTRLLFGMVQATRDEIHAAIAKHLGVRRPGRQAPIAFGWSLRFFRAWKTSED